MNTMSFEQPIAFDSAANPAPIAFEDGTTTYLSIGEIIPQDGFNPRLHFDDAEFSELCDSVKTQGVIQPLVVRPAYEQGKYWLVAGERRWRAARKTGVAEVPVVVRHLDDRNALLVATIENTQRANMAASEEARSANILLDTCGGDRGEAARQLGWSRSTLDSRLMLLHCAGEVLDALTGRSIKLGHAELLSQLPEATQVGTLAKVIEDSISVSDLKSRISGFVQNLSAALFDTAECAGCAHNSSLQASLFEAAEGMSGKCANRACFAQKTDEALQLKKQELAEDYPVVWLDTEKRSGSWELIAKTGGTGVGSEQAAACAGCGNYGALMDSHPDRVGQLTTGLCFDLECHKKMVGAYRKEVAASEPKSIEGATPAAATGSSKKAKASPKTVAVTPKKVIERVDGFYRGLSGAVVGSDTLSVAVLSAYALLADAGRPKEIMDKHDLKGHERSALVRQLFTKELDTLRNLMKELAVFVASKKNIDQFDSTEYTETSVNVLAASGTELVGHWQINAEFLKAHTKSGIEGVLKEAGFDSWYNKAFADEKKKGAPFDRFMKQKTGELIEAIMAAGFDFSTFVPTCVSKRLEEAKCKLAADAATTDLQPDNAA